MFHVESQPSSPSPNLLVPSNHCIRSLARDDHLFNHEAHYHQPRLMIYLNSLMSTPLMCRMNANTSQHVENEPGCCSIMSSLDVGDCWRGGGSRVSCLLWWKPIATDGLLRRRPSAVPRVTWSRVCQQVLGVVRVSVALGDFRCLKWVHLHEQTDVAISAEPNKRCIMKHMDAFFAMEVLCSWAARCKRSLSALITIYDS